MVALTAQDAGSSEIEWSCQFDCDAEAADFLRENVENTYRGGFIAALRQSLRS